MRKLILTTRGSKLAVWQADYVASLAAEKGVASEKLILKTTGDRVQNRFLHEIGGKGLFIKELEQALLSGDADLAVHSLKDLPARVAKEFRLAAVLKRHSPADALIFRPDVAERLGLGDGPLSAAAFASLGPLKIGTGSLRRQALISLHSPESRCEGVRGNVDTRLGRLYDGAWDALILAEASLQRLGLDKQVIYRPLATDWFLPCAGQGALAIESKAGTEAGDWAAKELECKTTRLAVDMERAVLARLGGDCTLPFGCIATPEPNGAWTIRAGIFAQGRKPALATVHEERIDDGGRQAVDRLMHGLEESDGAEVLRFLGLAVPGEWGG